MRRLSDGDADRIERDDVANLVVSKHRAHVVAVLLAEPVAENAIDIRGERRSTSNHEVTSRVREVEDEEAEFRPFEKVLHLLSGIA